jgi:hypothetical protein
MSAYASRRNATLALVAVGLAVTACERPSAPEAQPTSTEAKVVVGSFGPRPIDDSYRRINSLAPSFGGMYWDTDDTFVVVLTDVSQLQAAQNAIYRVFPTYVERFGSKTWRAQLGLFTYSQLADWRDVLTTNVLQEAEINAVGIDQIGNRLSVGVPTEAEISAAKVLVVSAGVPLNAVTVEVLGGVVRTASLEDRIRPAPAGVWIEQDQGFFCTLGPIGTVWSGPGPHYFLTASHCTAVQGGAADGSVFFQNHPPSETNRLAFEVGMRRSTRTKPADVHWTESARRRTRPFFSSTTRPILTGIFWPKRRSSALRHPAPRKSTTMGGRMATGGRFTVLRDTTWIHGR